MKALLLYTLLSTALFYLGSRATITMPLWSRYPPTLAKLMDCPACIGFWWGAILHIVVGQHAFPKFFGLPMAPYTPIVVGLCTLVTTPILMGIMQRGLDTTGDAVGQLIPGYTSNSDEEQEPHD